MPLFRKAFVVFVLAYYPAVMGFSAAASVKEAKSLTDGVKLIHGDVILPCVGYGTYRLGKGNAYSATLNALKCGYRCIDTAFIYANQSTEKSVGDAIQTALKRGIIQSREDIFVITKTWRAYHGYEPTKKCLEQSLKHLKLDYIDLWLMHWPGPAYNTMNRKRKVIEEEGPWYYAKTNQEDLAHVRSETWRAMEDAFKDGTKVRAIGVSNFTTKHLNTLKRTATIWPPAVNQIECHPLYPQDELTQYCKSHNIVVQAYASLGGQDMSKKAWLELLNTEEDGGGKGKKPKIPKIKHLLEAPIVQEIADELQKTPAQVLLRWALERNMVIIPKATSVQRMEENTQVLDFHLTAEHCTAIQQLAPENVEEGRLCWRRDPLRLLDFD